MSPSPPQWTIAPRVGVGPVHVGMSRDEAVSVLSDAGSVFVRPVRSDEPGVDVEEEALFAYCRSGSVEAVEIGNLVEAERAGRVTLFDWDVFATPTAALIRELNTSDCPVVLSEHATVVTAPTLGVAFWRGGDDHGLVDELELPRFFNSVLVAGPSYFGDLVRAIGAGTDS